MTQAPNRLSHFWILHRISKWIQAFKPILYCTVERDGRGHSTTVLCISNIPLPLFRLTVPDQSHPSLPKASREINAVQYLPSFRHPSRRPASHSQEGRRLSFWLQDKNTTATSHGSRQHTVQDIHYAPAIRNCQTFHMSFPSVSAKRAKRSSAQPQIR